MKLKQLQQISNADIKLLKILKLFVNVAALHLLKVCWVLADLQLAYI